MASQDSRNFTIDMVSSLVTSPRNLVQVLYKGEIP